jgi:hypothetical protein
MRLLDLTPAEVAFLTLPAATADALQLRLTRKLAATLSARLRLPIQAQAASAPVEASATPVWQPDAALATLWLTRRLGGRHVLGAACRVPPSLIQTLDAMLAECWLDAPLPSALPSALAWQLTCDRSQATLAVQLPHSTTDMTRWAREVIRHG